MTTLRDTLARLGNQVASPAAAGRSTLTHLECTYCGERYDADRLMTTCTKCQRVLYARYDLERARHTLTPDSLARRRWDMWRYQEVLPVRDPANVVSLGEGMTPLLPARPAGVAIGVPNLLLKDEGKNPTGSFKARGLGCAVSRAKELGVKAIALPSAGNAASAAAAYGAAAGLDVHVFMPRDVPETNRVECLQYGANVTLVDGLINDAGARVRELAPQHGWFDVSTLKEPYRQEGKKTMGYELAEQLGWTLPDVIVYPTGGGTGIVGMWKAFDEMEQLGLIGSARPRMVSVQAEGCAPIVRAFERGERHAELWQNAHTAAAGMRVPVAIGDYLILGAIRENGGTAITVSEEEICEGQLALGRLAGVYAAPEGGATYAALAKLRASGFVAERELVVLFQTGMGIKYDSVICCQGPTCREQGIACQRAAGVTTIAR
ncbi:MAG: threonine synthase [Chloroflexota bacterium]|nr:threonine synthase [Chloroflexota bacterium]